MQTIKTAVVVVLLLFVLYGGYVALNGNDTALKPELEELLSPGDFAADVSGPAALMPTAPSQNADAFAKFANAPLPSFSPSGNPSNGPSGAANSMQPSTNANQIPSLDLPELSIPSSPSPSSAAALAPLPNAVPAIPVSSVNSATARLNADAVANAMPTVAGGSNAPARQTPTNVPGFGLAVPNAGVAGSSPASNSNGADPITPPSLALPNLHGEAKTLGDVTKQRLNEETVSQATAASIPASKPGRSYENAKQLAIQQAEKGLLKDALATLSMFYNAQELTTAQRTDMIDLLDALAREVIYSRRHLMELQYVIAPGETLEQIAKRYNVPQEVLARINGINEGSEPEAGVQLKVIQGPFRAEVNLANQEITLFLGELYAGRYPASFGNEPQPQPGIYEVADKQRTRNYYSANGMQISADDPKNPYGGFWIDLGQDVCIHGSPELDSGASNLGCIGLSPLDASDVFGMLGRGSEVTIRR